MKQPGTIYSRATHESFVFIRSVVAALLLAGAPLLHAQNLVTNGGFENGFTGWVNATSGGGSASFTLETNLQYWGARCLKTVVANPGADFWNVETRGPTFTNFGTNRSVSITFLARAATNGAIIRAVMQTGTYKQKEFTLSTAWTRYTWNHTTAEASPQLKFQYLSRGTVWLDEVSLVANPDPGTNTRISLDPSIRHQTMDGIGGALTWYSIRVLDSPSRNTLEQLIFDDLGLDIIRLKNWYYPQAYPTNKSPSNIVGWERNNFNANATFYQMAKTNGRDVKILLSSWTPPPNLKSNNARTNGTLKKVNGQYVYGDFAQYWVDMLDNMNWTPDYVSIQNEPGYVSVNETCDLAPTQTSTKAGYAEALDAIYNRISTRTNVPVLIGSEAENIPAFNSDIVPLRSRTYPGIYAYHTYNIGDPTQTDSAIPSLNNIRAESTNATSGRPNWMSEFSKGEFNWLETAKLIHNTFVEANASAYIYWALVWAADTSPPTPNVERVFSIDGSGQYAIGDTYYTLKHFAKHISRGYQRIEVTDTGTNANLRASAYINPAANQLTLIVLNTGNTDDVISLRFPGLPVTSATAFRTRQFDIGGFPYRALGTITVTNDQAISKNSITTYVINLADTLNPYDPALLRVDQFARSGGQASVTIPAQPGHNFILWKSTTLAGGPWQQVTNAVVTESAGQLTLTDTNSASTRAFYRVQRDTGL